VLPASIRGEPQLSLIEKKNKGGRRWMKKIESKGRLSLIEKKPL